jgi:serine/threonine-protein kinase HipA
MDKGKVLQVFLGDNYAGRLVQEITGQLSFAYDETYLKSNHAQALSYSLPLRTERFTGRECKGFFSGVLPESQQREIIARNLGISARNDFTLLERIGGECAGAVSFLPEGNFPKGIEHTYREVSKDELAGLLRELPNRPLLAGERGVRLSLAGVQDKLAVMMQGDEIYLPLGGAPSSHILKPAIVRFQNLVFNESLCLQLASEVGLSAVKASVHQVGEIPYLLIERYDRKRDKNGKLQRIHQEDFCQAFNIPPMLKYQNEGGPDLVKSFELMRNVSSIPAIDLKRLLDAVIFNFLIGNNDAHGKNFSIVYNGENTSLAPLYDVVCTAYYPELSPKMAMSIGGKYEVSAVFPRHFEALSTKIGINAKIVLNSIVELIHKLMAALERRVGVDATSRDLATLIYNRCLKAKKRFG